MKKDELWKVREKALKELEESKKINFEENIKFVRWYVKWMKSVPNEVWSRQQAELIDSVLPVRVGEIKKIKVEKDEKHKNNQKNAK